MVAGWLESTGALLAVMTPLVAIPLTVITFYLRSLREHQVSWHDALVRRVEMLERAATDLRKVLTEFERDYTGKEEWLRECMYTRRVLEQLIKTTVRMEATIHVFRPGADAIPRRESPGTTGAPTAPSRGCRAGDPNEGNE